MEILALSITSFFLSNDKFNRFIVTVRYINGHLEQEFQKILLHRPGGTLWSGKRPMELRIQHVQKSIRCGCHHSLWKHLRPRRSQRFIHLRIRRMLRSQSRILDGGHSHAFQKMQTRCCNSQRKNLCLWRVRWKLVSQIRRMLRSSSQQMVLYCSDERNSESCGTGGQYGSTLGDWWIWRNEKFIDCGNVQPGYGWMDLCFLHGISWRWSRCMIQVHIAGALSSYNDTLSISCNCYTFQKNSYVVSTKISVWDFNFFNT